MQTSKAKRSSRWQNWLVYVLLWSFGVAGMGWVSREILEAIPLNRFTQQQLEFISILLPTMLMWMIPVLVTERVFKRSMRNWLVYTLLGTLTAMVWSDLFPWNSKLPLVVFLSSVSFLWGSLFQMAWLWRRVNRAWIWPVTQVAIWQIFRFFLPSGVSLSTPLPVILLTLVQQFVMACVMYYLWIYQAKDTQKAKVSAAVADSAQSDEARIQRLQEAEEHRSPWDYGENQALRNEV